MTTNVTQNQPDHIFNKIPPKILFKVPQHLSHKETSLFFNTCKTGRALLSSYQDIVYWKGRIFEDTGVAFVNSVSLKYLKSFYLTNAVAKYRIAAIKNLTCYVSQGGSVFGCGKSFEGELPGEKKQSISFPKKFNFDHNDKIKKIYSGLYRIFAVTSSGQVLGKGRGCFFPNTKNEYGKLDCKAKSLLVGLGANAIVSEKGHVRVFGNYDFFGNDLDKNKHPLGMFEGKKIMQIIPSNNEGMCRFLALTDDGIYFWENRAVGKSDSPQVVPFEKKAVQLSYGDYESYALTEEGSVYSLGIHKCLDNIQVSKLCPNKIKSLKEKKIIQLSSGKMHHLALSEDGEVFSWKVEGDSFVSHDCKASSPEQVEFLKNRKVIAVRTGDEHSLALTYDGQLYAWGRGREGQLGKSMHEKKGGLNLICNLHHEK